MSRSSKKKGKVPKITEAQYAEYISSLKANNTPMSALNVSKPLTVGAEIEIKERHEKGKIL